MSGAMLVVSFLLATAIGYRLLGAVPSLLHTPLMSGMNALSGITVVAAVLTWSRAATFPEQVMSVLAILLATVNVAAGFVVTHRMLRMFKGEGTRRSS